MAGTKLVLLEDDEYDAIKAAGGAGRKASPSALAAEVAESLKMAKGKQYDDPKAGWARLGATSANPVKVLARELRKAQKQHNEANPDNPIRVEVRPREGHPKLGDFVAFRTYPVPVDSGDGGESTDK